jgi:Branched-chain amino acid aminotransferase/4-amino-4-deoxychorismate lyase
MVQLQRPKYAYYQGAVRPWEGAVIHAGAEGTYRGINVFEGLKAYWQPDGSMGIVAVPRHYERLQRSARLLHIPFEMSYEEFENALHSLIEPLCVPDQDIWVRATLYLVDGLWGEDQVSDLYCTAFLTPKDPPKPIRMGVSTWRRATDNMLPARIKTSTNYQVARLARIEGRSRGYSDMILLNSQDRVAESGVACVLMARNGRVVTPPATEGALESITVDIVEALAKDLGIPFERRPIDRTELYIADEICLAGTLAELQPVLSVDGHECLGRTNFLTTLAERYRNAVKGIDPHPVVDLSCRKYASHPEERERKAVAAR